MKEHGYAVRPLSTEAIARAAEDFLRRRAPETLASGTPVDLAYLVDVGLQQEGILVYPVSESDLPDAEAETRAGTHQSLEIWMRVEFFDALFVEDSNSNRGRSTLAHEIGHAILHARYLRTSAHHPALLGLTRAPRSQLKPFEDSEWQAHTFAGALLLPRPALLKADLTDIAGLAKKFLVSEAFVMSHLKRIRRLLRPRDNS